MAFDRRAVPPAAKLESQYGQLGREHQFRQHQQWLQPGHRQAGQRLPLLSTGVSLSIFMKKLLAVMALSIFGALCAYPEDSQPPHITVYGTATTEVVPDQMRWFLHVENRGPSLDSVAAEHTSVVGAVLEL